MKNILTLSLFTFLTITAYCQVPSTNIVTTTQPPAATVFTAPNVTTANLSAAASTVSGKTVDGKKFISCSAYQNPKTGLWTVTAVYR